MKVLLVDDSAIMRKIIIRTLNAVGVTDIVEGVDGNDAIAKFGAAHFDLVMTDWNMPGKSGLEVVTEIRATGSGVPVIMVTTECEAPRVIAAIKAGVTDYLSKPFDADTLKSKLERYVAV